MSEIIPHLHQTFAGAMRLRYQQPAWTCEAALIEGAAEALARVASLMPATAQRHGARAFAREAASLRRRLEALGGAPADPNTYLAERLAELRV